MKLWFEIEIEHGIPIPYIRGTYNSIWDKMKNGDSFIVPDKTHRSGALTAAGRDGHLVTSEKLNGNGYRVWLVKKKELI